MPTMVHRLHVACVRFPHPKICLESRAFVRDSFSDGAGLSFEDEVEIAVFIYSTLSKPPPMCTYTNFRRKENFYV